jgi:hypothetical protein
MKKLRAIFHSLLRFRKVDSFRVAQTDTPSQIST